MRSSIEKQVNNTIQANFTPRMLYPDVTTRDNREAPAVDVYIAGFPCQPFSVAGNRRGFEDGRAKVFDVLRFQISRNKE